MSGYLLPLLFPKHLVFPPSSSWHQKPFFGSNLQCEKYRGQGKAGLRFDISLIKREHNRQMVYSEASWEPDTGQTNFVLRDTWMTDVTAYKIMCDWMRENTKGQGTYRERRMHVRSARRDSKWPITPHVLNNTLHVNDHQRLTLRSCGSWVCSSSLETSGFCPSLQPVLFLASVHPEPGSDKNNVHLGYKVIYMFNEIIFKQ